MSFTKSIMVILAVAGVTACGETTGDRAISGAGIGAGTGAVIGAASGGSPLTGALIGGAAGGIGGAATTPDQVDLGKPVWR